jgi:hypothetical protein
MSAKTSPRRAARETARRTARALPRGYATFGAPDASGKYATFGLPCPVMAAREDY